MGVGHRVLVPQGSAGVRRDEEREEGKDGGGEG